MLKLFCNAVVSAVLLGPMPDLTPAPWAPCPVGTLGDKAAGLLVPIVRERVAAYREEFNSQGEYRGESAHTREFEKRFYALLDKRTPVADEALAVLPHIYIGEHRGEELECEIIHRGGRMLGHLETFQSCLPALHGVSIPRDLLDRLPNLYPDLISAIKKEEKCERD
jgi:hypothetical protein